NSSSTAATSCMVNSGARTGSPWRRRRLARSASDRAREAASSSITGNRSAVARCSQIGPRKPRATSSGRRPTWSIWAWLATTASRLAGSNGNAAALPASTSRLPCSIPQSSRTRRPATVTRCIEPVTPPAAPWNSISMLPSLPLARPLCTHDLRQSPGPRTGAYSARHCPARGHSHAREGRRFPNVNMRKTQALLLPLAIAAALAACSKDDTAATQADAAPALTLDESKLPPVNRFDLADLDETKQACDDFAGYANGKWLAANPIPGDRTSWGAFEMLDERSNAIQQQLAEQAGADTAATGVKKIVGDLWATGMDEAKINAQGIQPLAADLAAIDALSDTASIVDYLRTTAAKGGN